MRSTLTKFLDRLHGLASSFTDLDVTHDVLETNVAGIVRYTRPNGFAALAEVVYSVEPSPLHPSGTILVTLKNSFGEPVENGLPLEPGAGRHFEAFFDQLLGTLADAGGRSA